VRPHDASIAKLGQYVGGTLDGPRRREIEVELADESSELCKVLSRVAAASRMWLQWLTEGARRAPMPVNVPAISESGELALEPVGTLPAAMAERVRAAAMGAIARGQFDSVGALASRAGVDHELFSRFLHGDDVSLGIQVIKVCRLVGFQVVPGAETVARVCEEESIDTHLSSSETQSTTNALRRAQDVAFETALADDEEGVVWRGKLEGKSHSEIAEEIGRDCTTSEVDLIYRMLRRRWARLFGRSGEEHSG
jgi:hypothetical protein